MPKKLGRPKIKIEWDQAEKLCAIHCTGEEIAFILNVDYDTIASACKREHNVLFSDWIKQKAAQGKASLRRKQYTTAMSGNPTMLVWLGKNWLGQTDKSEEDKTS